MASAAIPISTAKRPDVKTRPELVSRHDPRWVFSPGQMLYVSHLALSVDEIPRGVVTELIDKEYWHSNHSDSHAGMHADRPVRIGEVVPDLKPAGYQAEDLFVESAKFGFVILDPLTNLSDVDVMPIVEALLPAGDPPTLKRLMLHVNGLGRESYEHLRKPLIGVAERTLVILKRACQMAWRHMNNHLNRTEAEMEQARAGKGGRLALDDYDRLCYEQTERAMPVERTMEFQNKGQDQAANLITDLVTAIKGDVKDDVANDRIAELEAANEQLISQQREMANSMPTMIAEAVAAAMAKVKK